MSTQKERALGSYTEALVKAKQRPSNGASRRVASAGVRAAKKGATAAELSAASNRALSIARAAGVLSGGKSGGRKKKR